MKMTDNFHVSRNRTTHLTEQSESKATKRVREMNNEGQRYLKEYEVHLGR